MSSILDTYLVQLATRVTQRGQRPSPATIRATRADLTGSSAGGSSASA
jgi:hypothetical protein